MKSDCHVECLTKIDDRDEVVGDGDILAFLTERNELLRLPFLLEYYRKLGVDLFFVVDDNSTDGSREYLLQQNDCFVYSPSTSYSESRFGRDWVESLMNAYAQGHWVMKIDADELLVYPRCESVNLKTFCSFLDKEGSQAFSVFLLDMYPEHGLSNAHCVSGRPFHEICPCFDRDYKFDVPGNLAPGTTVFPTRFTRGGPRLRLFYSEFLRDDIFSVSIRRLRKMVKDKIYRIFTGKYPASSNPPALSKIGLVKWCLGYSFPSAHVMDGPSTFSSVTGVFLHFKFFSDFHAKAIEEARRGQHYGGGQEYKRYVERLERSPTLSFVYDETRRYSGSAALLELGLLRESHEFREFVRARGKA